MTKTGRAISGLVAGYIVGGFIGLFLVSAMSSNTHDKGLETVMTAAFFTGPFGAVIGLIAALLWKQGIAGGEPQ